MCVPSLLAKPTDTLSECNNVLLFHGNNISPNAFRCYGGTNSASVVEGTFALWRECFEQNQTFGKEKRWCWR